MKTAVGSTNPVKINATKLAFKKVWPKKSWEVIGVNVSSGISDQPMTDEEYIKGATNRAKRPLQQSKADFSVGIEGGLHKIKDQWFDNAWIVVISKKGEIGVSSTFKLQTPKIIIKLVKSGMEVGQANDKIFNLKNSKQQMGHFGIMTKGLISRQDAYFQALICALSRFIIPKVYN